MSKEGMLRSILFDALSQKPALASVVLPRRWKKCNLLGGDLNEWGESELVQAFEILLQQANRKLRICLFLDGLDEFDGNHQGLVEMIQNATKSPHVKACLASRPWPVFGDAFSARPNLMLHQLTYQDILAFAEESLQKQPGFAILHRKDPAYASQLFDTIATRSEGVFLWVSLVIRSLTTGLSNCDRVSDLQRRLVELPSDLEKLYQHMFDSIEDFYVQHAYELLQLGKAGHGSLTALAMHCADEEDESAYLKATFEPFCDAEKRQGYECIKRRLQGPCKGLLEITQHVSPGYIRHPTSQFHASSDVTDGSTPARTQRTLRRRRNRAFPIIRLNSDETQQSSPEADPQLLNRDTDPETASRAQVDMADAQVTYLHRTARDFLQSEEIQSTLDQGCSSGFCPHLSLARGYLLMLKKTPKVTFSWTEVSTSGWKILHLCMTHLSMMQNRDELFGKLCHLLEMVDSVMTDHLAVDVNTGNGASVHWTTKRPGRHPESGFLAFAAEYRLHGYIVSQIKKGSAIFEVEKRQSLLFYAILEFEVYQVFAHNPPDLEGLSAPNLDVIRTVLETGADPNEAIQGTGKTIWEAVLIQAAELPKDRSLSKKLLRSMLSHWIPIIGEFIHHKADPRMNRNAASGSYIRDAFGVFFPQQAKALEKRLKALQSRLSSSGVFFVPLAAPGSPPGLDYVTSLPIHNRLRSEEETQGESFREYLQHGREIHANPRDDRPSYIDSRFYRNHELSQGLNTNYDRYYNELQTSLGSWVIPGYPFYFGDNENIYNLNGDPTDLSLPESRRENDPEGAQSEIYPQELLPPELGGDGFDDSSFVVSESRRRSGKGRRDQRR